MLVCETYKTVFNSLIVLLKPNLQVFDDSKTLEAVGLRFEIHKRFRLPFLIEESKK